VSNSVWESLWSTLVDPNKKPRKNFFVKNDHAQYGKEFEKIPLLNYYYFIFD